MRILLIEDEVALAGALARGLRRNAVAVDIAHDGQQGLALATSRSYDVIVLDRDLPLIAGDEICRRLTVQSTEAKILMLTASNTLTDRVVGLNLGADDYLGKPVRLVELLARLRALTRRRGSPTSEIVEWGDLRLDVHSARAWRGTDELPLTVREFMMLEELMRAQGQPLSAERLLALIFDDAYGTPTAAAVRLVVMRLRRKLGSPEVITTTTGRGYRLT
jgi:DNA-binding response OmpR family regulator